MSPTRWSRVSDLFARAIELEMSERERLLAGEDATLRAEVERLLEEHERPGGLLDEPLFSTISAAEHWTGQLLKDRYRIEVFLARGGAGAVYRARDEQLAGRPVIVKFLHAWARQYPWLKHKFRQEMEALARIDHHGVVGVLDAGEMQDGLPFLVMEYIDGVTLRSELESGPMEIQRVSRLIREIGRAVSAAHEKGVLHRDLKPENIMLEHPGTPEEAVRLIDFGIARIDQGDLETVTRVTQFAGTTPYMSPEQLAGKPERATDTYAMGVIAFEMLTERRPFQARSPVDLYEQQRAGVKANPRLERPEIPAPAVRAILKQLSFRPEDRSASALEAGEQIASALVGPAREAWSRRRAAGVLLGGAGTIAAGWLRMVA
jgi:serine/threonine-protein kinase